MAQFQIRELAHLTGIKAHTIRIWEQRYQLLAPERTPTNIRYYTDDDLRTLLNVAVLCEHGYRISRVATMNPSERAQAVEGVTARESSQPHRVQQLVLGLLNLDDAGFEHALNASIGELGLERAMMEVAYPFLGRIGILWQTGSITPSQEHMVTNIIRQKLITAIDQLGPSDPTAGGGRFILFLPERELHELALLFICYALRVRGQRVTYLGQNLPAHDLARVCQQLKPDFLLTVLTAVPDRDEVQQYLHALAGQHPDLPLLLYGNQVQYEWLELPPNARRFARMGDFLSWANLELADQKTD